MVRIALLMYCNNRNAPRGGGGGGGGGGLMQQCTGLVVGWLFSFTSFVMKLKRSCSFVVVVGGGRIYIALYSALVQTHSFRM